MNVEFEDVCSMAIDDATLKIYLHRNIFSSLKFYF